MRANTISSSISSIYVSVVLLLALISVNEKANGMFIQGETPKHTGRRSVDRKLYEYVAHNCPHCECVVKITNNLIHTIYKSPNYTIGQIFKISIPKNCSKDKIEPLETPGVFKMRYCLCACITFGQACLAGFGKRSYSKIERDSLEESINRNLIESNKIQHGLLEKNIDQNLVESKIPSTNDELFSILPNEEFRERLDQRYVRIRKDIQRFKSSPLSSLVNQLIAIHNRPHHRIDSDFTNK